ncbi:kin of IRRE-like protein 1 [Branchiostoma floridae]|uniref:Kin of IRRE-like protein 1 n=1 Tax=Branchiostoma floridae TaxID=7739 RepID=A0A9J7N2T8_BRAFL|nr:kin of IRRE-like protein 1 [Branchiostoma floridae]
MSFLTLMAVGAAICLSADAARYRVAPKSTAVLQGQRVTLQCAIDNLSSRAVVSWMGPPDFQIIANGDVVNPDYPRYRITGDHSRGVYNLQISDTKLSDQGNYRCSTFGLKPAQATLTVVVPLPRPPSISGGQTPVISSQRLILTCTCTGGHPPPQVTWYNGSREVDPAYVSTETSGTRIVQTLTVEAVSKWDNGANLSCTSDQRFPNLVKPKTSFRILRIHYPPTVNVPKSSIHVKEGMPTNLTCAVDSNPQAMITWEKLGHPFPIRGDERFLRSRKPTLNLPKVTRYDGGTYQCTADNGVAPSGRGTITLSVLYRPWIDPTMEKKVTILNGQDNFSLECLADGNPKPRIRWRRKDTSLYWENPLRFHRVRYDIEGTYECVATTKDFPEVTKETFIDVVGRPQIREETSDVISSTEGEATSLTCDVRADPLPTKITWLWRDTQGVEVELSHVQGDTSVKESSSKDEKSSSLTLKNVAISNGGTYVCHAANMFGTAQREIHLNVTESYRSLATVIAITIAAMIVLAGLVIGLLLARRRGWICGGLRTDDKNMSAPRPMPPVPKYAHKTGTIDSGVEDLELHEMEGTLKPRPPPRVDKDWTAIGLTYTGLAHPSTLPPYSTVERHRPDGEDLQGDGIFHEPLGHPHPPTRHSHGRLTLGGKRATARRTQLDNVINEQQSL